MWAWLDEETDPEAAPTSSFCEMINGDVADVASGDGGEGDVDDVQKKLSATKLSSSDNDAEPPSSSSRQDHPANNPQSQEMAQNFAMEHRIFLRAILDLLTERDQLAMEADVNSPNTIKIGSLRKASHRIKGLWKTKFVEIRKGTFSYFDDNAKQQRSTTNDHQSASVDSGHKLLRKDVPLRASSCTCRAVKIRSLKILPSNSGGAVFELRVQGGSRRLWMANTREERQSWIQAIHSAMIGASVTRGDNFLEYQAEHGDGEKKKNNKSNNFPLNSPYKESLEQYMEVRGATHGANSKEEYLHALSFLHGKAITVPVQWIKSHLDDTIAAASFLESGISTCVDQLWKDLLRDSVEINGEVLAGESFHGPERIVGKLTQQILSADASLRGDSKGLTSETRISEAQAITWARDVLLACDRTRSGGDSYFCAENLCLNRNLVVLCPSSTEANPLSIKVSTCNRQKNIKDNGVSETAGWALARGCSGKLWKRQYLVLSQNVLSCYAEAGPKPHELIEQVMLQGAKVGSLTYTVQKSKDKSVTGHIVKVTSQKGQLVREYLFEDEFDCLYWVDTLTKSALNRCDNEGKNPANGQNGIHNSPRNLPAAPTPTVDVVVNVSTEYKMCTLDPSGIENEDTWAALRTKFVQKFSLTGGPNGRISRGDEVVELALL